MPRGYRKDGTKLGFQKGNIVNLGKHHSEKTKKKWSLSRRGENNSHYGKYHTEEAKKKMALKAKKRIGEKASNWKGGVTPETLIRLLSPKWNRIRHQIYKRDDWTCQVCGKINCKVIAHHIIPYRISQDDSFENLLTVCTTCYSKAEMQYEILQRIR